jgi:hypothetical protein
MMWGLTKRSRERARGRGGGENQSLIFAASSSTVLRKVLLQLALIDIPAKILLSQLHAYVDPLFQQPNILS